MGGVDYLKEIPAGRADSSALAGMRLSSLGPWGQRGRSVWTASYADPTFARWISSAVSTLLRRWAASGDRPASVATDRLSTIKATVRMEAPSRARKDSRRSGRSPGGSAVPRRLEREQLGVQPASRHQLLVSPLAPQLAPLQYQDAVGHPHGGEAVRDQDGHAAVCQLREPQEHLVLRPRVERRGGPVEDQNLPIAHVSPPQRYLLPLAPRQVDAPVEPPAQHLVVAPLEAGGHRVRQTAPRRLAHPGLVAQRVHLAHADVLFQDEVVAHEVLEDHADVPAQAVQIVLPQVHAVEQDAPFIGVVQACEQLHERRLPRSVLAHQGNALARLEQEPEVPHGPAIRPGIAEADALELEPAPDGRGHGPRARLRRDPGPHVEEGEQVREVQALLEHLRHGEQDALNQVAALAKRRSEEHTSE